MVFGCLQDFGCSQETGICRVPEDDIIRTHCFVTAVCRVMGHPAYVMRKVLLIDAAGTHGETALCERPSHECIANALPSTPNMHELPQAIRLACDS